MLTYLVDVSNKGYTSIILKVRAMAAKPVKSHAGCNVVSKVLLHYVTTSYFYPILSNLFCETSLFFTKKIKFIYWLVSNHCFKKIHNYCSCNRIADIKQKLNFVTITLFF